MGIEALKAEMEIMKTAHAAELGQITDKLMDDAFGVSSLLSVLRLGVLLQANLLWWHPGNSCARTPG